jgi:hypothetical protein
MGRTNEPNAIPDTVVFDLVDAVLAELAPNERTLFAGLRGAQAKDIERRFTRSGRREDPLGFGIGESVVLLGPTLWVAVQAAAKEQAQAAAKKGFSFLMKRLVTAIGKKLRRKKPVPLPELGQAELNLVHEKVLLVLKENRVAHASVFADSICYQLQQATSLPPSPAEGS